MLSQRRTRHDRLTVLHLAQPVEGGVARVVADLARAHTRDGVRVVVACPPDGALAHAAVDAGATFVPWQARRELGPHVAAETLRADRLLRRLAPDVVHAHSAKAGLAARLALRGGLPTVYQPHAWSFEAVAGRTADLARRWERYAARWAVRTVCVSEAERRTGERAGVRGRLEVIRNGVDLDHFAAAAGTGARSRLPALAGLPGRAPLVVCVGRLCPQKGQGVLLDAWARVRARRPDAHLVFVGDGPDREHLAARAAAGPGGVTFAGACRDVRDWYAAADLVALPSRWEGMALTPLEAMAVGRPVVLTDVGGSCESLPPGQERHCLVRPSDPAALADAVSRLVADTRLRNRLGRAAQAHARTSFDVSRTAAAVLGLYHDLLRTPAPEGRERVTR